MTKEEKIEEEVQTALGTKFVTCVTCRHYHPSWWDGCAVCKASPNPTRINPESGEIEYEYDPGQWTSNSHYDSKYKIASKINTNGFCYMWVYDKNKKLRKIVKRIAIVSGVFLILGTIIFLVATSM